MFEFVLGYKPREKTEVGVRDSIRNFAKNYGFKVVIDVGENNYKFQVSIKRLCSVMYNSDLVMYTNCLKGTEVNRPSKSTLAKLVKIEGCSNLPKKISEIMQDKNFSRVFCDENLEKLLRI